MQENKYIPLLSHESSRVAGMATIRADKACNAIVR